MGGAGGLHPPATFHLGRSSRALSGPAGGDPKIIKNPKFAFFFFFSRRGGAPPLASSRAPPMGASPPPHRSSLLFPPCSCSFFGRGESLYVVIFLHFSPFLPFFNPKRAENCESFAAFHTCSTQNAEFVNRHNSSGKTNKQPRLAPADTHLLPPQKAAFSAQKRGGRHAHKPKTLSFFFL